MASSFLSASQPVRMLLLDWIWEIRGENKTRLSNEHIKSTQAALRCWTRRSEVSI
jgi:hypothetical protein